MVFITIPKQVTQYVVIRAYSNLPASIDLARQITKIDENVEGNPIY